MKTAIVHDWLTSAVGGGEDCLREIHRRFRREFDGFVRERFAAWGAR